MSCLNFKCSCWEPPEFLQGNLLSYLRSKVDELLTTIVWSGLRLIGQLWATGRRKSKSFSATCAFGLRVVTVTVVKSKYSLTPKKLLQKVSQLILVGFSVLFYIPKVYQSSTPGKVFFSRWRPRWPPKPLNDHNTVTINSNLMILVSISRFWGAKNTVRS